MTHEQSLINDIKKALETLQGIANIDVPDTEFNTSIAWLEGYRSATKNAVSHIEFTLKLHEQSKIFIDENEN